METINNKVCPLCGKKIDDPYKGVVSWVWYINCQNEGNWGYSLIHKECLVKSIVYPMIDDGDVGKLEEK
jgi:hypothetical protein